MNIAIVDSGISGLSAAWLLSQSHSVMVFEAADRVGGHSNTGQFESETGPVAVDAGFVVHTEVNYANMTALLRRFLPSDKSLTSAVTAAGLKLVEVDHFRKLHARTLQEWRARFHALAGDRGAWLRGHFKRLWHYYLCHCELGIEEGSIDVGLYTIEHA